MVFTIAIAHLEHLHVLSEVDPSIGQTYLVTIFNFSWNFSRIIRRIYENLAEAEEMTVILTTPHEITDDKNAKKLRIKNPSISFNNVSFSYKNNKRIINNLSFDIKSKEKIAYDPFK